jgi:uncharacterized protein (DUF433 family)
LNGIDFDPKIETVEADSKGINPYFCSMDIREIITVDADILGGQAVFKNTRVPIESLFDFLEAGDSLDEFLNQFPTVKKEQAVALLDWTSKLFNSKNPDQLYASVA